MYSEFLHVHVLGSHFSCISNNENFEIELKNFANNPYCFEVLLHIILWLDKSLKKITGSTQILIWMRQGTV